MVDKYDAMVIYQIASPILPQPYGIFYLHEWLSFMVFHVEKYTIHTMDGIG